MFAWHHDGSQPPTRSLVPVLLAWMSAKALALPAAQQRRALVRLFILWVGVPVAAVTGGIAWAWLLGVIGPTYVWSIGVILVGVYYWCRARTESERITTLTVTASILGILLAAAMLNAVG